MPSAPGVPVLGLPCSLARAGKSTHFPCQRPFCGDSSVELKQRSRLAGARVAWGDGIGQFDGFRCDALGHICSPINLGSVAIWGGSGGLKAIHGRYLDSVAHLVSGLQRVDRCAAFEYGGAAASVEYACSLGALRVGDQPSGASWRQHRLDGFRRTSAELARWLISRARRNDQGGASRCFVACNSQRVVMGFCALRLAAYRMRLCRETSAEHAGSGACGGAGSLGDTCGLGGAGHRQRVAQGCCPADLAGLAAVGHPSVAASSNRPLIQ